MTHRRVPRDVISRTCTWPFFMVNGRAAYCIWSVPRGILQQWRSGGNRIIAICTLLGFDQLSITVAPPNLEVIMSYIILFDRQFVPLSGPNSRRTRTEHVQNEGCFFGEKGTCNCNASSGPWAQAVGNMPVPALCPGHALVLALPSTLPSTLSVIGPSADVVRGFIGTLQPPHTFRSSFGSSPFRTDPGPPERLRAV